MSYERKGPAAWAIHPGEILKEEFLRPMKLSGYSLAKSLNVTAQRVSDIVLKKSGISADMAIRLGKFFGTSPEFWMNLQASYELALAGKSLKKQIERIKPHRERVA
jgi:addiction module HigA family antidote